MNINTDHHVQGLFAQLQFLKGELIKIEEQVDRAMKKPLTSRSLGEAKKLFANHKELQGRILSCSREVDKLEKMMKE